MGSFLSLVQALKEITTSCPLRGLSLAKVREFHASFRSVCADFALNLTQFEKIFELSSETFAIWDTANNGKVNAFELFAGLVMFADAKAEDKLLFLFDLFDFNSLQSITLMDCEFAIQMVLSSTSKIFGFQEESHDAEINQLVRSFFPDGVSISIAQMLKFAAESEQVKTFFALFHMEGPEHIPIESYRDDILVAKPVSVNDKEGKEVVLLDQKSNWTPNQLIKDQRMGNLRKYLGLAFQPLISYRISRRTVHNFRKPLNEIGAKIDWVYGVRCQDVKRALQYTSGRLNSLSTGTKFGYQKLSSKLCQETVYINAKLAILFNPLVNSQRFYTHHHQELISLSVGNTDQSLVATGELCKEPAIHIWSSQSLQTLKVLKGIHRKGVGLLSFSADDRHLVSTGLASSNPVLVYDWRVGEVVLSLSSPSKFQDVFGLPDLSNPAQTGFHSESKTDFHQPVYRKRQIHPQFIVLLSLTELMIIQISHIASIEYLSLKTSQTSSVPTCTLALIADQKNHFSQSQNDQKQHLILTGHEDGSVLIFSSKQYVGALTCYRKDSVTCISKCFKGIAIGTMKGFVYIWDNLLMNQIQVLQMNQFGTPLRSPHLVSMDFHHKNLLILTFKGDFMEVNLSNKKLTYAKSIQKLDQQMQAMCLINQEPPAVIVAGENGIIQTFDINDHELLDLWQVSADVTALDALAIEEGGFIIAAGTATGNVIIRQDWEEFIPRSHQCGQKSPILDLKFSKNQQLLAAASQDQHVYLLQYQDQDYVQFASINLDQGYPISLNFSDDSSQIAITTNLRTMLILNSKTLSQSFKIEEISQLYWSTWSQMYPLFTKPPCKPLLPISLGNTAISVACGDEKGHLYIWKSLESLQRNTGSCLSHHASGIERLLFTNDDQFLLTLGSQDGALIQWKMKKLQEEEVGGEMVDEQWQQRTAAIEISEDSLQNELNFSASMLSMKKHKIKDGTLLIRGTENRFLNEVHAFSDFEFEEPVWKRAPSTSLILDHIYGIQTSDKRNTVMFCHMTPDYSLQRDAEGIVRQVYTRYQTVMSNSFKQEEAGRNQLAPELSYELSHNPRLECQPWLLYFCGKFGICLNLETNEQSSYKSHSMKISCLTQHPFLPLAASGEACREPQIHIWDCLTKEPLSVLDTAHDGGVFQMAFSRNGQLLVSIGLDKGFSLQVFDWSSKQTLAFRNIGALPIFAVKFDPFDNTKFITCGYEHLQIWKLKGKDLTCKDFIKLKNIISKEGSGEDNSQRNILLCCDFLSYNLGYSIQSQAFFGSNLGEISSYSEGKYFILHENAHQGPINCLKITDAFGDSVKIVTGGEDGFVKIWDSTLQLINFIDMREQLAVSKLRDLGSSPGVFGVQSIDIYICQDQQEQKMLIALRCGEVLETTVSDVHIEEDMTKKDLNPQVQNKWLLNSADNKLVPFRRLRGKEKLVIEFKKESLISSHASLEKNPNQKQVHIATFPFHPLIVSAGDDQVLRLWHCTKNKLLTAKYIGSRANSLSLSPDGNFLAVGLASGVMMIVDSRVERKKNSEQQIEEAIKKKKEEIEPPTFEVLMCPQETLGRAQVLSVQFSCKGEFLAVSYNNDPALSQLDHVAAEMLLGPTGKKKKQTNVVSIDKASGQERAFIILYIHSQSRRPALKQLENKRKEPYIKFRRIGLPFGNIPAEKQLQMAVKSLDFSDDDRYLQLCLERVDPVTNIADQNDQEFSVVKVWDIDAAKFVESGVEVQQKCKWPQYSLSSQIFARYQGDELGILPIEKAQEAYYLEKCGINCVQRVQNEIDYALLGTTEGELHVFRFPALVTDATQAHNFEPQNLRKQDMALSRGFSAHASAVNGISVYEQHDVQMVVTTSVQDQCILQWKFEYEEVEWELDYNAFIQEELSDPFHETPLRSKFKSLVKEIWEARQEIPELHNQIDRKEQIQEHISLHLDQIIGRRAFDRRNNITLDVEGKILYIAGSKVVLMEHSQDGKQLSKQHFLSPDSVDKHSTMPEISCMKLANDSRTLFIGTAQIQASLLIWEVPTLSQLKKIELPTCCVIQDIAVAHDEKHVALLALTLDYVQAIVLIDTENEQILAFKQIMHSLPFKIKSIIFQQRSTRKIITAGIQHMMFWHLSGRQLQASVGAIYIPKTFMNVGQGVSQNQPSQKQNFGLSLVCDVNDQFDEAQDDNELQNFYASFLVLCFAKSVLLASADDGFIYIWEQQSITRRVEAHNGPVLAMDSDEKLGFVVTGSMDGSFSLFKLDIEPRSHKKDLLLIKKFSITKLETQHVLTEADFNIQAVSLGENRIIVGTRSGAIYEQEIDLKRDSLTGLKVWLKAQDDTLIQSLDFDLLSTRIYILTHDGKFMVQVLNTLDTVFRHLFEQPAKNVIALKTTERVLVVLEQNVAGFSYLPKKDEYELDKNLKLESKGIIQTARLSPNEQILAISTLAGNAPVIELYLVKKSLEYIRPLYGFQAAVQYVDFSIDSFYLHCEEINGNFLFYEIETRAVFNTETIDFEIEFLRDGVKREEKIKSVHNFYDRNNEITQLQKFKKKPILLAADEIGTIRSFIYPNEKGKLYYAIKSDHLHVINQMLLSTDLQYLLTQSNFDKSIIKWRIQYHEDKRPKEKKKRLEEEESKEN